MKKSLSAYFLFIFSFLMVLPLWANFSVPEDSLTDTNREAYEIASSHFQHNLFVEEISLSFSTAEKLPAQGNGNFLFHQAFEFSGIFCGIHKLQPAFLADLKYLNFQYLFPFHSFF